MSSGSEPFDKFARQYDNWFEKNKFAYHSELAAIRALLPRKGRGLEVGVGSGRFAGPLGVTDGVEPAENMADIAKARGISVLQGRAEALPHEDGLFDFVLMVTAICFIEGTAAAFAEAFRVLKPGGSVVIGFIDKNSPIGLIYQEFKDKNVFYKVANFFSVDEVTGYLQQAGFDDFQYVQTIFRELEDINQPEPVSEGYGEGSFVVIKARKPALQAEKT